MIFQSYVTSGYPLHDILPHHLVPFPLPELFELGQDPFYWWTITTEKWYPSHIFPNSKVPRIDKLGIPISRAISGKISSNTIAPKVPIRIFRGGSCCGRLVLLSQAIRCWYPPVLENISPVRATQDAWNSKGGARPRCAMWVPSSKNLDVVWYIIYPLVNCYITMEKSTCFNG